MFLASVTLYRIKFYQGTPRWIYCRYMYDIKSYMAAFLRYFINGLKINILLGIL